MTKRRKPDVSDHHLDQLFAGLRRFPDVEAPNLQAWDATDRLLLETAAGLHDGAPVAVIGDNYGALTLGLLTPGTTGGAGDPETPAIRVHQDLITGERALRRNAEA